MKENLVSIRWRLHEIIFEADTPAGKWFDVILIASILLSVSVVMVESIEDVRRGYGPLLFRVEWFFTIMFSVEYALRLFCIRRPWRYATSFFGVVDLLAILPTYLDLLLPGSHYLVVIRVLRVIRVFRILKLVQYLKEATMLAVALKNSFRRITVFLVAVLTMVVVLGSCMYVIESDASGFTSIPRSIYWAIVTLTTVGYGDISPQTGLGQTLAAGVMILGYGIIAVPTGMVTVELTRALTRTSTQVCPDCGAEGHDDDALFCRRCGQRMNRK